MAGGESIEHHLLKLELANAARAAGFLAEYEVAGPDGSWRADVMATSVDGTRRVALEAQLSPITPDEICARTNKYEQNGVAVCWFGIRLRPWVGSVPSLVLDFPDSNRNGWIVRAGIARMAKLDAESFFKQWISVEDVTLADAVAWILHEKMRPHKPLSLAKMVIDQDSRQWPPHWVGSVLAEWRIWWTTVRHIDIDTQQHHDHQERARISNLRTRNPMRAFRARTKIENIDRLQSLLLKQFNNNATRSKSDFLIRVDGMYADGLALYGYHWHRVFGRSRDAKPLVVVFPDVLDGHYWADDVPVAFPVSCRGRLSGIKNLWFFDLDRDSIWPAEPKNSAISSALDSWRTPRTGAPLDLGGSRRLGPND
jgi:hypothetical protein